MKRRRTSQPGLFLFLTAFFLYCLASPGNLPGDTEIRWSVARQFVRTQSFQIEDTVTTHYYATGIDGKRYSFWGLGQSVILLPFAYFGLMLEEVFGLGANLSDLVAQFLSSVLLFPAVGALTVWLFFRVLLLLGYPTKSAILTSAVFGFATMHFHYTVFTHEQSQVALLLLFELWCMIKSQKTKRFIYLWLMCVAIGICLSFRLSSALEVLSIFIVAFFSEAIANRNSSKFTIIPKWLWAFFIGTGPFIIMMGWYNYIRFGTIFESGYGIAAKTMFGGIGAFGSNPVYSLAGMLFSPGKSIFLYNPVFFLLLFCIYRLYQGHKSIAIATSLVVIGNFIFNSFHTTWAGDYAWSCRYQASVLPFLTLPLIIFFDKPHTMVIKTIGALIIGISFVIQIASVTYNFNLEFAQNPNHCIIPDSYIWKWNQSHLVKRFDNIGRHIINQRDFRSVEVSKEESRLLKTNRGINDVKMAYSINYFPFKARAMMVSSKLFYQLLGLWSVCLLIFFACAVRLLFITVYLFKKNN